MPTFVGDALADGRQSHRCFNHEHAHELMDQRISCTNIDLGVEGYIRVQSSLLTAFLSAL